MDAEKKYKLKKVAVYTGAVLLTLFVWRLIFENLKN